MAMRTCPGLLQALALALAPAVASADGSIACEGGIVSTGDSKVDLLGKCGQPALREVRGVERGALHGGAGVAQTFGADVVVEAWTYDLGPRRFVQVVVIENGRVRYVERGGYGYRDASGGRRIPVSTCNGFVDVGLVKLDVLARCGEPTTVDAWEEHVGWVALDRDVGIGSGEGWTILHELWAYNLGPRRLQLLVHLANGKVVKVESGGYGYE
jgi:hypothetical protein